MTFTDLVRTSSSPSSSTCTRSSSSSSPPDRIVTRNKPKQMKEESFSKNILFISVGVVAILYVAWSSWAIWMLSSAENAHKLWPIPIGKIPKNTNTINLKKEGLSLNETSTNNEFQTISNLAPVCNPLKPEDIHYTLATQVSTERLWMVPQHCKRWKGPISVAVFTSESIGEIHKKIGDGCETGQLRIQTISSEGVEEGEYPVNALRNLALSAVQTSHVVYVDIDFWQSTNLLEVLNLKYVREELADDDLLAIVIPAFQLARQCSGDDISNECEQKNIDKMPKNKLEVSTLVKSHEASPFDPTNRGGHGSTEYGHWFKQRRAQFHDIPCIRSNRYEPYMVFRYCQKFPPFQESFTGYGKNKMSQIMHMRRTGYIFSQLGDVFVIHYPHPSSTSRKVWGQKAKKKGSNKKVDRASLKRSQVDRLFVQFKRWLKSDVPDMERVHLCADAADDDKTLWV